jgi:hypothetical protein
MVKKRENRIKNNPNIVCVCLLFRKALKPWDLGFFGVPETILINKNEKILLKYVGPLKENDYNKIVSRIREWDNATDI